MEARNQEMGEYWGWVRTEWSVMVPTLLMLLLVLLSPMLFDLLG
jgi:hypothetical protein